MKLFCVNLWRNGPKASRKFLGLALACGVLSGSALAQGVLFNNGPIITAGPPITGLPPTASASTLQKVALSMNMYGAGLAKLAGLRLADDFIIPANVTWEISSIDFYTYMTGSGTTSPMNNTNVKLWNGAPNAGGTLVYDGSASNQQVSSTFSNIYRISDEGTPGTGRPIMTSRAQIPGPVVLGPGTYWVDYQQDSTTALSGPFAVPVTVLGQTGKAGANSLIYDPTGSPNWQAIIDVGNPANPPINAPQDLAFKVNGYYRLLPTGYLVTGGYEIGGTLSSLFGSDDDRLQILGDPLSPSPRVEVYTTSPITTVISFVFTYEAQSSRLDEVESLQLWDWTLNGGAGNWASPAASSRAPTILDSVVNVTVSVNPNNCINQSTRQMKIRLNWIPASDIAASDGWLSQLDLVRWRLSP